LLEAQKTACTSIMLAKFGKFPFEHFAWGQLLLYYNRVSMLSKNCILRKAWEAQLTMLAVGKKCWAGSVKKWLLKNQPHEVVGFLPPIQSSLETTSQPTTTRALQARPTQPLLGMALKTMHIHPTPLVGVRGWAESQVLWCNAHNVRVGARMAKLIALQLM
jgi:hypothetical protein